MLEGLVAMLVTGLLIGVSESIAKMIPLVDADGEPVEFVNVPEAVTPILLPPTVNEFTWIKSTLNESDMIPRSIPPMTGSIPPMNVAVIVHCPHRRLVDPQSDGNVKLNNPPVTVVVENTCPVGVSGPWRSTNVMFNRPVLSDVAIFGTEGLFVTLTPSVSPGTKKVVATPDATGSSRTTLFCDMAVMNMVEFLTKLDGMISDILRATNDCVQKG